MNYPRWQDSWDQRGAHLGPISPRWVPCWSHEPCYQGCSTSAIVALYAISCHSACHYDALLKQSLVFSGLFQDQSHNHVIFPCLRIKERKTCKNIPTYPPNYSACSGLLYIMLLASHYSACPAWGLSL